MSTNTKTVKAPPEVVFSVLADPPTYEHWVVGNKEIRGYDPDWPAAGTEFQHTVGFGPLAVKDKTVSVEALPPTSLVMRVRAMPVGVGTVTLRLDPVEGGTRVVMEEHPVEGPPRRLWNPVLDRLAWLRNAESLRRLARLAERRVADGR